MSAGESAEPDALFAQVASILQRRCLGCHNDHDRKGDFSIQSGKGIFESAFVVPNDSSSSYLLEVVIPENGQAQMPKDESPLTTEEIDVLRRWIEQGARWPEAFRIEEAVVRDLDWWSLRPLQPPPVPDNSEILQAHNQTTSLEKPRRSDSTRRRLRQRTPIDAFIQQKLDERGLAASDEADRSTLIRRIYFDLLGLPPTPEEVTAFVADPDPLAYERLVDRLLASPRYGERWARHWLDVVHYADTHGYDKDKPRPNAWPYRDYVVRAFNQDKPYSRFVREQIAGDALWPESPEGITATGFISAGPWDFIGHAEVPETKIDGQIARHLDRDDMVTSTMNTFCSVTVQCARCHNHKFDPITQEHYYSLQAVFAALDRADRPYDPDPAIAARRWQLQQELEQLDQRRQDIEQLIAAKIGDQLNRLDRRIESLQQQTSDSQQPEFGYHSRIEKRADVIKWVQVDLGRSREVTRIVYAACHDDFGGIGAGFGFPLRFQIAISDDPEFGTSRLVVDQTASDFPNPGTEPQEIRIPSTTGRFIRFTAMKLAERRSDYIFALAELQAFDSAGNNITLGKKVTSLDSIEAPPRWQRTNLVDGIFPGRDRKDEDERAIQELRRQRIALLEANIDQPILAELDRLHDAREAIQSEIERLPKPHMVYAGTVYTGSGAFQGTGANGGKPRRIHVLHRGDILSPGDLVDPGTIPIIPGVPSRFDLPADHSEKERRIALAQWIVRPDNPLTWRSIVNRIWLYHFGRGIVDSPNDFGRMGKRPSHPELLDWLAVEFRDNGQSMKRLHRLIVTSSVYRQSSADDPHNRRHDSENIYLWRMNRRRLSAEEIRDSVLAVSGKLDLRMFGPGFQQFVLERPEHSPHYEYHKHDPDDPASHRRSVYRFIVRSQPDPFMTTLDCADSSQSVPKRIETLTAPQALSLLNNKFMTRMAEHFADRLERDSVSVEQLVARGFWLVAGHEPTDQQKQLLLKYVDRHGTKNLCRLLLNLNEFVFID
ncbi:MAG: DUF1553 domain-containing protein [Planctomycetota bacterium]|nr:MAG: DUF1553 domain-containing protein [Planctomycetota bacterium]